MADASTWTFGPVTPETWPDMQALFQGRGGPRECWCMMWRKDLDGRGPPRPAADRHRAMAGLAQAGRQIGILGYDGAVPIAWCSVAPRTAFRQGLSPVPADTGLWSLTCFFIRADHRGRAGFQALVTAAEAFAASQGATAIEAYPVPTDSPSYLFCGFLPAFEQAGYVALGLAGSRRHVVRKSLLP